MDEETTLRITKCEDEYIKELITRNQYLTEELERLNQRR